MRNFRSVFFGLCLLSGLSCKTTTLNLRGQHHGNKKPESVDNKPATTTTQVKDTVLTPPATQGPDAVKTVPPTFVFDAITPLDPFNPAAPLVAIPGNPFTGTRLLVNPIFTQQIDFSASKAPQLKDKIVAYRNVPTAIWLDSVSRVDLILDKALALAKKQQSKPREVVVTLVVYDLPNRDCFAQASNGEFKSGELARYKSEYIDRIGKILGNYPDVAVVVILEPDSLPNLVTNADKPRCNDPKTATEYKEGVSYAIKTLSDKLATIYIDIAHAGWLGWAFNTDDVNTARRNNLQAIMKEVITAGGGNVRGFVTNVANYTALREPANIIRKAYFQGNEVLDEYSFVEKLKVLFDAPNAHFIVDTSRNGNPLARTDLAHWCNVNGSGLGVKPLIGPRDGVDAFLWIKTPGESDGVSDASATRFDGSCQSVDSLRGAPQAGIWFHEHFLNLLQNAQHAVPQ